MKQVAVIQCHEAFKPRESDDLESRATALEPDRAAHQIKDHQERQRADNRHGADPLAA